MIKPVNMFWNASHMRSALEYVLECCKKVMFWNAARKFVLGCAYHANSFILLQLGNSFICFFTCSISTIVSIKKRKGYDTLVYCLLNYIQHSRGHASRVSRLTKLREYLDHFKMVYGY